MYLLSTFSTLEKWDDKIYWRLPFVCSLSHRNAESEGSNWVLCRLGWACWLASCDVTAYTSAMLGTSEPAIRIDSILGEFVSDRTAEWNSTHTAAVARVLGAFHTFSIVRPATDGLVVLRWAANDFDRIDRKPVVGRVTITRGGCFCR